MAGGIGNAAGGLRYESYKRPFEGEDLQGSPKRQSLNQPGLQTQVPPNQCHVSALGDLINGGSDPNQGQQGDVRSLSDLMIETGPSGPSGAVTASISNGFRFPNPPAPDIKMDQINPLIDQWFNGFEDLSKRLSITLKKALVEKQPTRNAIWWYKDFYSRMITKINELKLSSQQFDNSLALGLLFHMIVFAQKIKFNAHKIDDLKFQGQRTQSPVSFGFFPSSGNNSCILSEVRNDSCVFIGHQDWNKVEEGRTVFIDGGGTILMPNGDVMCSEVLNHRNRAKTLLYFGNLYKKNGNCWSGTFKLLDPVLNPKTGEKSQDPTFVPAGDKTVVQETLTNPNGSIAHHFYVGKFTKDAKQFQGRWYCSETNQYDSSQLKYEGKMKRCSRILYVYRREGLGTVYFTKDISVFGSWKNEVLSAGKITTDTINVNNRGVQKSLNGDFRGLWLKFEGNRMEGIRFPLCDISKRNLATFFLENHCIEMSDTVRYELQQKVSHVAPARPGAAAPSPRPAAVLARLGIPAPGPAGLAAAAPSPIAAAAQGRLGIPAAGPERAQMPGGGAGAGGAVANSASNKAKIMKEFDMLLDGIKRLQSDPLALSFLKDMVRLTKEYPSEFPRMMQINYMYHILLYKQLVRFSLAVRALSSYAMAQSLQNKIPGTDVTRIINNIDYFNNPDIIGTKERLSNQDFLNYITSNDFKHHIADRCNGNTMLRELDEFQQKIERELTKHDRQTRFKINYYREFRIFLAGNNSSGAHPLPFVQELDAKLSHIEQLMEQYASVPHARQNPVRRGDFVVPYKIDKDCSNRIFILLQNKGLITAETLNFQRKYNYMEELEKAFSGSDLMQYLGDIQLYVAQNYVAQNKDKKCTLTKESFVKEGHPNTEEDQIIFDQLRHHNILDGNGNVVLPDGQTVDELDLNVVLPSEVNHYEIHVRNVLRKSAESIMV